MTLIPEVCTRRSKLAAMYEAHAPEAGRLAFLLTGDRQLAEDIVHDAFVRMAGRFEHLRDPDAVGAYLRRIVVNLVRTQWRRAGVERRFIQRQRSEHPVEPMQDVARERTIRSALDRLPHKQRAAVVLRYYVDLSEQQTADMLGTTVGAVKSLTHRGMKTLRAELGDEDHG